MKGTHRLRRRGTKSRLTSGSNYQHRIPGATGDFSVTRPTGDSTTPVPIRSFDTTRNRGGSSWPVASHRRSGRHSTPERIERPGPIRHRRPQSYRTAHDEGDFPRNTGFPSEEHEDALEGVLMLLRDTFRTPSDQWRGRYRTRGCLCSRRLVYPVQSFRDNHTFERCGKPFASSRKFLPLYYEVCCP